MICEKVCIVLRLSYFPDHDISCLPWLPACPACPQEKNASYECFQANGDIVTVAVFAPASCHRSGARCRCRLPPPPPSAPPPSAPPLPVCQAFAGIVLAATAALRSSYSCSRHFTSPPPACLPCCPARWPPTCLLTPACLLTLPASPSLPAYLQPRA